MRLHLLLPAVLIIGCEGSLLSSFESAPSTAPRVRDGAALYGQYCSGCHGPLERSAKTNATVARITWALENEADMRPLRAALEQADLEAIALALTRTNDLFPTCDQPTELPTSELVRLSNVEYDNTLRDLLGIAGRPSVDRHFAQDSAWSKFTNIGGVNHVQSTQLEAYVDTAYELADEVLSTPALWKKFYPDSCTADCDPAALDKLLSLGGRRPATVEERERYLALNQRLLAEGLPWEVARRWTFAAALSSPRFLFKHFPHSAPGDATKHEALDGYSLATRLSYFLWQSMPDDELFAAAAAGELSTDAQLEAQALRMLRDPKAAALVDTLFTQWFELNHLDDAMPDPVLFAGFTPGVRAAMKTEARMFFFDLVRSDRSFYELLQGDASFVDAELARWYELPAPTGTDFVRVSRAGTPREKTGVFGLGSFLTMTSKADESNVIRRARWVLDNLNCELPVKPPAGVSQNTTGLTGAQAANQRKTDAFCAGCHSQMDPVGLSLENFSAVGQYRTHYASGAAVDSNGVLPNGQAVTSARQLGEVMALDQRFRTCMAEKLIIFSLNRKPSEADECTVNKLGLVHVTADQPFSRLVVGVIKSPLFTHHRGLE